MIPIQNFVPVQNSNPEGINQWSHGGSAGVVAHTVKHVAFSQKERREAAKPTVKEAHKALTSEGFVKGEAEKKVQQSTKMGRSAAYSGGGDTKRTEYTHETGRTATLIERHPKYGDSEVTVIHRPPPMRSSE